TVTEIDSFNEWILAVRDKIFPKLTLTNYEEELAIYPQSFLPGLLFMSESLEQADLLSFQFCPLISSFIPGYITLDTSCLIEMFVQKNKKYYLDNVRQYNKKIWNGFFKMAK